MLLSAPSHPRILLLRMDPIEGRTLGDALSAQGAEPIVGRSLNPARVASNAPDVVVVDVDAVERDATTIVADLAGGVPGCAVVLLADSADPARVEEAVLAGAAGYLSKTLDVDALCRAVCGAARGELAAPRSVAASLVDRLHELPGDDEPQD
jgi:DNA-binding NarL/FixJ family response regulator